MWKQGPLAVSRGSSELASGDKYVLKSEAASADRIPRADTSAAAASTVVPTAELAAVALVGGQEMAVPIQPRKGVDAISQAMNALDVKEYTTESDASAPRYNLRSNSGHSLNGVSSSSLTGTEKRRKSATQQAIAQRT